MGLGITWSWAIRSLGAGIPTELNEVAKYPANLSQIIFPEGGIRLDVYCPNKARFFVRIGSGCWAACFNTCHLWLPGFGQCNDLQPAYNKVLSICLIEAFFCFNHGSFDVLSITCAGMTEFSNAPVSIIYIDRAISHCCIEPICDVICCTATRLKSSLINAWVIILYSHLQICCLFSLKPEAFVCSSSRRGAPFRCQSFGCVLCSALDVILRKK